MPQSLVLRQFLYRDVGLVRDFLAQLEGGISPRSRNSRRATSKSGISGRLNAGIATAGADRGGETFEEDERVVEQTVASQFEALHRRLDSSKALKVVEALDDKRWQQLRRGEIVEVEVVIQIAGFRKLEDLTNQFAKFMGFLETVGSAPDLGAANALTGMRALSALDNDNVVGVIGTVIGAPDYKFASLLQRKFLRVDVEALEGEATLFGKLQRKLVPGEDHIAMPGLTAFLRASGQASDSFLGMFETEGASNFGLVNPRIAHPGGVVAPIALFR